MSGFECRFIELAGQVNSQMPLHVVTIVIDALNTEAKSVRGSKVLILGVTYKRDVDDTRESPAIDIIELLHAKGADVSFSDPFVNEMNCDGARLQAKPLTPELLESVDCAVIIADHTQFDFRMIAEHSPLVVDTRNALKGFNGSHIHRL